MHPSHEIEMLTRETLIQLAMSRCHAQSESTGWPQWAQGIMIVVELV